MQQCSIHLATAVYVSLRAGSPFWPLDSVNARGLGRGRRLEVPSPLSPRVHRRACQQANYMWAYRSRELGQLSFFRNNVRIPCRRMLHYLEKNRTSEKGHPFLSMATCTPFSDHSVEHKRSSRWWANFVQVYVSSSTTTPGRHQHRALGKLLKQTTDRDRIRTISVYVIAILKRSAPNANKNQPSSCSTLSTTMIYSPLQFFWWLLNDRRNPENQKTKHGTLSS